MREIDPHLPIDSSAKYVVSRANDQQREFRQSTVISSMVKLPTTQFTGPLRDDLTGYKCGRFTVIGHSFIKPKTLRKIHTTRWVVRCECGRFQLLTTKAVKNNSKQTMCVECKQTERDQYHND